MAKGPGRRRGWKRIEIYNHRMSGVDAPIYLNTADSTFDGWIGGESFRGDTLDEVKTLIKDELDAREGFELQHVLEIEMPSYYSYSSTFQPKNGYFGFDMRDYWVSVNPVGKDQKYLINTSKYSLPEDALMDRLRRDAITWNNWDTRYSGGEFSPPCERRGVIWLPYSEETVAALEHLQSQINEVTANFMEFINSETGYKQMNEIGAKLMAAQPAPEEE